jgi:hypothetical protein
LVDQDGGEVWRDDSVEVCIDRTRDHQHYDQFVVNTLGRRAPAEGWRAAVRLKPPGWTVELAIPHTGTVPQPGEIWGINLCRTRPARPQAEGEVSTWATTGDEAGHSPEKFGHLLFEK